MANTDIVGRENDRRKTWCKRPYLQEVPRKKRSNNREDTGNRFAKTRGTSEAHYNEVI